jgi:YegS/Rv2252/BmrU family lipid kinase
MKAVLILNSSAGMFSDNQNLLKDIQNLFRKNNIDIELFDLQKNDLSSLSDKTNSYSHKIIIAAGGDGTIRSAAEIAIRENLTFGILPLGTLNHFAKDLNIPIDISESIEVIKRKNTITVDAAKANGKIFLNNTSIGLYPKVVKHREAQMEALGRNKWKAMLFALVSMFKRFPLFKIELTVNGKILNRTSPVIFIGNNKYEMDLFRLGTRRSIQKGKLSLYIVNCKTRVRFIFLLLNILFNRLKADEDFESYETRSLKIFTGRKKIQAALDGEVIKFDNSIEFEILPAALNVIVPA